MGIYGYNEEIDKIKNHIMSKYKVEDMILFGSCAKGRVTKRSDIDICLIMETDNKRQVIMDIMLEAGIDIDLDIVIYTPQEWQKYKDDSATFAGIINRTGVKLIG